MSIIRDFKYQLKNGTIISKLLIINILVFLIQSIIYLFFTLSGNEDTFANILSWFYFPKYLIRENSANDLISKPWSIITYQFFHSPRSILHILFNMLYLYFFGRILVDFLNKKFVLPLYLTGGIVGAIVFMLTYNLSPAFKDQDAVLLGASASILAIVVAAATLVPDFTVFMILIGPVKLKYIALFAIVVDMVSISARINEGGHLSHLGGALTGYLYILSYQRGKNWFGWWPKFEEKIAGLFERKKPKVAFVNQKPGTPAASKKQKDANNQKRMDEILDKIAKSGYDSLSKAEKEFLFKISNEK